MNMEQRINMQLIHTEEQIGAECQRAHEDIITGLGEVFGIDLNEMDQVRQMGMHAVLKVCIVRLVSGVGKKSMDFATFVNREHFKKWLDENDEGEEWKRA